MRLFFNILVLWCNKLNWKTSLRAPKLKSSLPEVFLEKVVLKICSNFSREHPCRSEISIFVEIARRHGSSPVNLLHIFRTPFLKNTSGRLLLKTILSWYTVLYSTNLRAYNILEMFWKFITNIFWTAFDCLIWQKFPRNCFWYTQLK